ncbi:MAG: hypothetical protein ACLPVY_18405 [Acidimicrobiia bacterium]
MLIAVIGKYRKRADKATRSDDERTALIELERAGDCVRPAAEADIGGADAARQAVSDAHNAICIAKARL